MLRDLIGSILILAGGLLGILAGRAIGHSITALFGL